MQIKMLNSSLVASIVLFFQITTFGQHYQSLSWKITSKRSKQPSYLHGTMHVQDERVFKFKQEVQNAFDNASALALELNMDSINPFALTQRLVLDSNKVLKDLYTAEQYDSIVDFFKDSLQLNIVLFERMSPFFLEQMIVTKDLQKNETDALDMYLFKQAKAANKQIIGLETMDEQLSTLTSIPLKIQADNLMESIRNYGKDDGFDTEKMMTWYTEGNLDSLAAMTETYSESNDEFNQEFQENFIVNRNKNMVDRVLPYLKKGNIFIAVGAAHLPGKDGIIELLRSKGYTVEPIN